MSNKREIILLALIAVIAIIGLVLMIKLSSSGMTSLYPYRTMSGLYGGGYYAGHATNKVARERFFKGGSQEGLVVETQYRKSYLPGMGVPKCSDPSHRSISKQQYNSLIGIYQDICVPPTYPEDHPMDMCCPSRYSHR